MCKLRMLPGAPVQCVGYVFDGLDRLTKVGATTYSYDSLDRVLTRNTSEVFKYAGSEMDPAMDSTSVSYQRSPSGSLLGVTRSGVLSLVGSQRHGDVAFTLNPSTGAVNDSSVLDPFGKSLGSSGTGLRPGFQGDWTDPGSGLVWMGARWYSPSTGTFVSRDSYGGSLGVYGALNRYSYGLNNPLGYTDPSGHVPVSVADGVTDDYDPTTKCTTRSWSNGRQASTTSTTCDDGSMSVGNTSSGVSASINAKGELTRNGSSTVLSGPPPNTNVFTYAMPSGGSVSCGQAASAGGYGRTCTYQRADGGWGVVGAGGFRGLDAGGNLVESGVIDRNNFDDFSEGTINVGRAAVELAVGADYAYVAEKYDSPKSLGKKKIPNGMVCDIVENPNPSPMSPSTTLRGCRRPEDDTTPYPTREEQEKQADRRKRAKVAAAEAKYYEWASKNPGAAINAGNPVAYSNPAVPVTVSTYGKIPPGSGVSLPGIGTVLEFGYNFLDGCIVGAPAGASLAGGATFVVAGPLFVPPMTAVGSVVGCVGLGLGQATGVVTHQPVLG
jgi:RHS repeat-associated protein